MECIEMSTICLAFFTIDSKTKKVAQHLIFKTELSTAWHSVYDETIQSCRAIRDTRLAFLDDWDVLPDARLHVFASAAHIVPDTPLCCEADREKIMLILWEDCLIRGL